MFDFTQPIRSGSEFVGRQEIRDSCRDAARSTVFLGEARIGKTSLLLQLERDLEGTSGRTGPRLPFYINVRKPTLESPADFYNELMQAAVIRLRIASGVEVSVEPLPHRPAPKDVLKLLETIDRRGLKYEFIMLLDNIDQPLRFVDSRQDFFFGLRSILDFAPGDTFKILASASPYFLHLESAIISKLSSRLSLVQIPALEFSEVRKLVERSEEIKESQQREVICRFAFEETGGHPCLAQELLLNAMARRAAAQSVLKAMEAEAESIRNRGGSFFAQYMRELEFEDIASLIALSFADEHEGLSNQREVVERFSSAGLITNTESGRPAVRCKLFFAWLRHNLGKVLPESVATHQRRLTLAGLATWFKDNLVPAMNMRIPRSERHLQDIVQAMLVAYGLPHIRERRINYDGKQPRVDFALESFNCALEIKLVKSLVRIGDAIDQILADIELYKEGFSSFMAIVVTPTESPQLSKFISAINNPYRHIIQIPVESANG